MIVNSATEPRLQSPPYLAWHAAHRGKALQWFLKRLQQPKALEKLLKSDK